MRTSPSIERIGANDLMQLASDVGPAPMNVGAVLLVRPEPGFDLAQAQAALARRVEQVRRLRQRLVRVPWGLGRPLWVDDPAFDVTAHIRTAPCPAPGDRDALLDVAADAVTTPLPEDRPRWRALFVTGLADGRVGLVLVLHHVVVDGIGGLAVLAALVDHAAEVATPTPDGAGMPPGSAPPVPAPTRSELLADVVRSRVAALREAPQALARLRLARAELGATAVESAPRCSINAPTGPRRRVRTVGVPLEGMRDLAHRYDATVNDVLLTVVTSALESVLRTRGESVPALVVSVPVSARVSTTATSLGNAVGVMPVRVPLAPPLTRRLACVAALTRERRQATRGASAALLGPAFRLLAALGILRWFVDRQRLVNSFLTNIAGPPRPLRFAGAAVEEVVPVTVTAGNVTVAFAALSYAGTLTICVITDPDRVPDATLVTTALERSLAALKG